MKTMKEKFQNWLDLDVAGFELMTLLGILDEDQGEIGKRIMNANDETGDCVTEMLFNLADAGILEKREFEFRWDSDFRGSWQEAIAHRGHVSESPDRAAIERTLYLMLCRAANNGWPIDDAVEFICEQVRRDADAMKSVFKFKDQDEPTKDAGR